MWFCHVVGLKCISSPGTLWKFKIALQDVVTSHLSSTGSIKAWNLHFDPPLSVLYNFLAVINEPWSRMKIQPFLKIILFMEQRFALKGFAHRHQTGRPTEGCFPVRKLCCYTPFWLTWASFHCTPSTFRLAWLLFHNNISLWQMVEVSGSCWKLPCLLNLLSTEQLICSCWQWFPRD